LPRQISHRSVIWNLLAADPRELAIDQIGTHLPRQRFVTPIAHVLQQQHTKHDFGWRCLAAARLALLAALGQLFLDDEQQGVIFQGLIRVAHPSLPKILHRLVEEAIGKVPL
jgi:hypothetical protein